MWNYSEKPGFNQKMIYQNTGASSSCSEIVLFLENVFDGSVTDSFTERKKNKFKINTIYFQKNLHSDEK